MVKRFYCCSGSRKRKIFEPYFTETGSRQLRCVGEDDIFDYIQSFKDSTDMRTILKRFELGDSSALNAQRGFYGDFSAAPRTLSEFLNAQIKANNLFASLPFEVRASFNDDPNQFFMKMGTAEFDQVISKFTCNDDSVKENVYNEP